MQLSLRVVIVLIYLAFLASLMIPGIILGLKDGSEYATANMLVLHGLLLSVIEQVLYNTREGRVVLTHPHQSE